MTELVLAVFDAASAADAAVQDLEVARIPSAVIQRKVSGSTSAQPSVTVAVDEIHAAAVTGILNQYGPLQIEERTAYPELEARGAAIQVEKQPGGAVRLLNDHDPKPLCCQFDAEHKGEFSWRYPEQGPQVWRVEIGPTKLVRAEAR